MSESNDDLPRLTTDFPGIGGTIKARVEDFFVQELPLYEPSGEGEHVYCEIQKVGIPTFEAIHRIAAGLRVSSRDIGYAGLKDARAVTRQILSIQGTTEEAVMGLRVPDVAVQWAVRHTNKLRLGHLAGNRFAIKIRDVDPMSVIRLKGPLDVLQRRGMPNYFGEQRFGRRGDNDLLGAALVREDAEGLLRLLLGGPNREVDDERSAEAREAFERGDFEASVKLWPPRSGLERRILERFMKSGDATSSVRAIDEKLRRLWLSALQSRIFNEVLARRVRAGTMDRLVAGDLAYKHDSGACFRVEDVNAEQARADAFEISPSGPLLGFRMTMPEGDALAIEQSVFAEFGLKAEDFRGKEIGKIKGARRPLRVKPRDVKLESGVDNFGGYVTVAFTLPAGSFATVLLDELM